MDKTDSKPVSDKELEEESEIEEVIEKDGAGYGDLQSLNAQPDDTNRDAETYVGRPAPVKSETYIQERKSYSMGMTDQNKLKNTKLGDHINYYDNGVSGNGIVSKMSGQFIQIFKDDGKFYNININDTFHVSDILINKTWDAMNLEERTDQLLKIKAYSPRFLSKTWDQLPRELKDVMKKDDWDKNERDNERRSGRGGRGDGDKSDDHSRSFKDVQEMLHHQGSSRGAAGQGYGTENIDPKKQTFGEDDEEYKEIYERQANSTLKSRISKAEWDLMKDTEQDERGAKREQSHYFSDDDESEPFSIGNEEPPKPKRIPKKVKITKAEWDAIKASPQHGNADIKDFEDDQTSQGQASHQKFHDHYDTMNIKEYANSDIDGDSKKLLNVDRSSSEDGAFGNTGSSPTTGVSTKIPFDATEDYEGTTHDTRPTQFEYEDEKPEVGNEPKAPEVKLDEQGLIKANPSFVYSDNPQGYKLPPQTKQKGYGMRYGVKYINEEEDN